MRDRLVEAGRARAASVGWPDAYAFTKALGEQALTDSKGDVPVSIVRPSIIESAWAEPRPGWIRGFRMAEPVIISYARGLLSEFPGVPEGTVDVIPVDLVVAAIIAVAALGPEEAPAITPGRVGRHQPAEVPGARRQRQRLVHRAPALRQRGPADRRARVPLPRPRPGAGPARPGQDVITRGEKLLQALPLRGKQAELSAKLETKRMEVERALEYVELYGLYTECEAIYQVDNLLAMWDATRRRRPGGVHLRPPRRRLADYIRKIHLPSIVQHARVKTTPGKTTTDRTDRLRRQVLAPTRHVAAFDLENTLIASNVVESYSWLATRRLDRGERLRYVLRTLAEAPGPAEARPRRPRRLPAPLLPPLRGRPRRRRSRPTPQELLTQLILTKSFPAGLRRVREHRALGHRTILITGALDFAVEGLRPLFDEIIAAEMTVRPDGTYRARCCRCRPPARPGPRCSPTTARAEGLRLDEAVAYADSTSDLPMLEAVGFPVAVNPETRLAAIARKRGWLVEHWAKASGGPRPLLPIGPLMVERERRRSFDERSIRVFGASECRRGGHRRTLGRRNGLG